MEIKIIGKPKTGKTIVATKIVKVLESLGASVMVKDMDNPKYVPPDSKPLAGQKVIVSIEYLPKGK